MTGRSDAGDAERGCARPYRPGPARLPNSSQSHRTLPTSLPIGMGLQKNCGSLPFNARDILIMKQFSRRPGPAWAGARGVLPRSGKAGGGAQQRDRPATRPGSPTGSGGPELVPQRGRGLGFFGCCWGLPRQVKCQSIFARFQKKFRIWQRQDACSRDSVFQGIPLVSGPPPLHFPSC